MGGSRIWRTTLVLIAGLSVCARTAVAQAPAALAGEEPVKTQNPTGPGHSPGGE